jgi:hypothetical protein
MMSTFLEADNPLATETLTKEGPPGTLRTRCTTILSTMEIGKT